MEGQTLIVGPSPKVIENAIEAFEAGHRLLCSWINAELELFKTSVRIEVEPPKAGSTLALARLGLSNALVGYRPFRPALEPDARLEVWLLFFYKDDEGKNRGGVAKLVQDWGETSEGVTEEQYWRGEFARLVGLREAYLWTDDQWRERVVEPILDNARRATEWLAAGGATDGDGELPQLLSQRVRLSGPTDRPTIDGIAKPKLTTAQYNVVQTLIEAGSDGLTKDELTKKSGHSDAVGILRRLCDDDADWEHVISFAGKPGGGYRIR